MSQASTTTPRRAQDPELQPVRISEGQVLVMVYGTGRPVLFLHGVSAHGRSWRPVARAFAAGNPGWACWVPDLLGRGESEAPAGCRYRLDDEVRRLRELIEALGGPDDTHRGFPGLIAGHSQGAAIALALASCEPRVRGLLLSNPVTDDTRRPRSLAALDSAAARALIGSAFAPLSRPLGRLILRRAGGPHFRPSRDAVEAYSSPYRDPARARMLMRILADWRPADLADRMPERDMAAHVVAGRHDPRIPPPAAERLARRLGSGYTLVEDGGHVLPEQHPDLLADLLGSVARRVTASEA